MANNPKQKKQKLISGMSHDLRSPLVAVRNSIALILDKRTGSLNSEQKKILKIAERNLKRLSLSIDKLLGSVKSEEKRNK